MKQLVQNLMEAGCLRSPEIISAFEKIDRADFVPKEMKAYAYEDRPLPIGFGQTISQPCVVAFMLELLRPRQGEKILDVGSGSGWQSSLLAQITGKTGEVTAIEKIPELYLFGKQNAQKYGFENLKFIKGDGTAYFGKNLFDKIIVAASSRMELPKVFKAELKVGGRIVIPIAESIFVFIKVNDNDFSKEEYPGFLFVPLV